MAHGTGPLNPRSAPWIAGAILVLLTLGPLAAIAFRAEWAGGLSADDRGALWFTAWQAAASALISVALAVPVARALARRRFPGRGVLITLLGAPFLLPVLAAVVGLLAVFGRSGWLNDALGLLGLPPVSIYGAHGVILGHVFLNLPLATRLILQGWQTVPAEQFRLAATLGAPVWTTIERPMLRTTLPGALLVIFLICLTSFAVALILGGGPRATTVELAIYQAIRFEADLGRAALLAAVQVALCTVAALALWRAGAPGARLTGLDRPVLRFDGATTPARLADATAIALATLFLVLPLAALTVDGLGAWSDLPISAWQALVRSLAVAGASTLLALILAAALASREGPAQTSVSVLPLAVSSLVIGTGLFIIVLPFGPPTRFALPVTALVNAILAVPFAVRILAPAIAEVRAEHGRLVAAMGLGPWAALRIVYLPRLARPLGFAAGLSATLSMGDLGVITLFSDGRFETLPLSIFRLLGAYRADAASAATLLLIVATFGVFALLDGLGRIHART